MIYVVFLLYGFLLASHDRLQKGIERTRWLSLGAGAILVATLIYLWAGSGDPVFGTARYTLIFSIFGLSAWCWILALLGFGRRHLNFHTAWLNYANEAVLPFYILHQTVLLIIGFFVVRWPIPDPLKWGVIAASSLVICMALYEFVVRRVNVLRFLFGMKWLPQRAVTRQASMPVA